MKTKRSLRHRLAIARDMVLGQPRGFFVDYAHTASIPAQVETYAAVEALFERKKPDIVQEMHGYSTHLPDLRRRIGEGTMPWVNHQQFPQIDMMAAYCTVRATAPSRIVEIGSGTSTHVLAAAAKDNGTGAITCIDPVPRREIQSLGVEFLPRILSNGDVDLFAGFAPGDLLFIDSSHLFLPGCDVDIQFNRIFPVLPSGALVHVHDIFLPDGYPEHWCERRFAEQNALIGWIVSGYFDVLFPAQYVATRMQAQLGELMGDLMPDEPTIHAGSIWLRKA